MKALLNREIQLLKTINGSETDFRGITIMLSSLIFCIAFGKVNLFFVVFSICSILNIIALIEETKIRQGILSMTCTRKEYVKFKFLFNSTSIAIIFIISAILEIVFSKITRRPYVRLEYMIVFFFIILIILTINLMMFFVVSENAIRIVSIISMGLIMLTNVIFISKKMLSRKVNLNTYLNTINNWTSLLTVLIFSIAFIFISMAISIHLFEKRDLQKSLI